MVMLRTWQTILVVFQCFLSSRTSYATQGRQGAAIISSPGLDPFGRRIIGGSPAESELIWVTQITKVGTDSKRCTGNLLNSRWMATAAHCVLNAEEDGYLEPEGTSITYGCLNVHSSSCKTVSAVRFVPHPCYTPSRDQDHDDIVLMELSEEVLLEGGPFPFIDGVDGTVPWEVNMSITLAGFGVTETGGASSDLLAVDVPLASTPVCEESNPTALGKGFLNFECMFCTGGSAGKDSCNGDSGGPAIVRREGGAWLVGVLSIGSELPRQGGCGVEGRYGVYTRVSRYASFINSTLSGTVGLDDPCVCASGSRQHSVWWSLLLVSVSVALLTRR